MRASFPFPKLLNFATRCRARGRAIASAPWRRSHPSEGSSLQHQYLPLKNLYPLAEVSESKNAKSAQFLAFPPPACIPALSSFRKIYTKLLNLVNVRTTFSRKSANSGLNRPNALTSGLSGPCVARTLAASIAHQSGHSLYGHTATQKDRKAPCVTSSSLLLLRLVLWR